MKISKIVLCLAPFAIVGFANASEVSSRIIELPTVVVEATRIADPLTEMRNVLERSAQVSSPARLNVKFELLTELAKSPDLKLGSAAGDASIKSAQPTRRLL